MAISPAFGIAAALIMPGQGALLGSGQAKNGKAAPSPVSGPISNLAYQELTNRVSANQANFFVYLDEDSGLNHGFPSGFFGTGPQVSIDTGCIDDPSDTNIGCYPSTDTSVLDRVHGTVFRVTFPSESGGQFTGLNIEEPEDWGETQSGIGYALTGATAVEFDVRSPGGITVQFGVGQCSTPFIEIPAGVTYTHMSFPLSSLTGSSCPPNLSDVHVLFTVVTNAWEAPNGGTVLLDNIQFTPVPSRTDQGFETSSLPLSTQTFGVVPQQAPPYPPDQVNRNVAAIYESALTVLALLDRGQPGDLSDAQEIANTFHYALYHDNHGDFIPTSPSSGTGCFGGAGAPQCGLHNAYESGDIALLNDQVLPGEGKAGDIRLAGFSSTSCGVYCLDLDGATGGNNAFAVLALLAAYRQFNDTTYLNDAVAIANWIASLEDASGQGYGGYFLGYPDQGLAKIVQTSKSIENNADIFAAFSLLAEVETSVGNPGAAAQWTANAGVAANFVLAMYDPVNGRFNAGTVPAGTQPGPGVCPTGPQMGNDVINVCDFLDADSFTTLAMAGSQQYGVFSQYSSYWPAAVLYLLNLAPPNSFTQTVNATGLNFSGFDLVPAPPMTGVAWEFTSQAVGAMRYIDSLQGQLTYESEANSYLAQIQLAQASAPFNDGQGVVASTLQNGNTLPPVDQCLTTPFQCIPERAGLAATVWGIFAEQGINPFTIDEITRVPGSLAQISVGADGSVWGINSADQIYWFNPSTQNWQQIPGELTQIAVGASGYVWGINALGEIYRYDPNTQNWDLIPGNLSKIAVGSDGDVWGINSAQQVYHFNPAIQNWDQIGGSLEQIAVGSDSAVWGINSAQQIYRFNPGTQAFQQAPGLLAQIGVGADGAVWGISAAQQIYRFNTLTQNWDQMPGQLTQIAVGSSGNVWGLNADQNIYQFNLQTQSWEQIPGQLSEIAVGADGAVWGINAADQIYEFNQPPQPTGLFVQLPGLLSQIGVGADGNVWGINAQNQVYHYDWGIQNWDPVPGSLTQIAVGFGGNVWGLNAANQIFRFNLATQNWDPIPGSLTQIAVGANGDVWGINEAQQIYRFNPVTQNWQPIPGQLAQIAVGADGAVWGINAVQEIYRFNPQTQNWDPIPGSLTQIAVGASNYVWGINVEQQIYQFNVQTQNWDSIPGELTQLAVAFDGAVWGVNAAQQVYRFDPQTQNWDSIPGQLTKVAVGGDAAVWGLNATDQIFQFQ